MRQTLSICRYIHLPLKGPVDAIKITYLRCMFVQWAICKTNNVSLTYISQINKTKIYLRSIQPLKFIVRLERHKNITSVSNEGNQIRSVYSTLSRETVYCSTSIWTNRLQIFQQLIVTCKNDHNSKKEEFPDIQI